MNKENEDYCALCEQWSVLKKSHFIPSSVYREISSITKEGHNQIIAHRDEAKPLFKDITQFLLCTKCEQLFSSFGENYILKLYKRDRELNIPKILKIYLPLIDNNTNLQVINHTGDINDDMFTYFAISIFWRGVFDWPNYDKIHLNKKIQDEMREYLLFKTPFKSFKIISLPIYKVDAYNVIFPKPYTRNKIFGGDFFYFTIMCHCFILVENEPLNSYAKRNSIILNENKELFHINSKIMQEEILFDFINFYKTIKHVIGKKYSTELTWVYRYIYIPTHTINGKVVYNIPHVNWTELIKKPTHSDYSFWEYVASSNYISPSNFYIPDNKDNVSFCYHPTIDIL